MTVDEDLVTAAQSLGEASLSSVVNAALAEEVDRRARAAALGRVLAEWDAAFGPVDEPHRAAAAAAFDDLDATAGPPPGSSERRRGVA